MPPRRTRAALLFVAALGVLMLPAALGVAAGGAATDHGSGESSLSPPREHADSVLTMVGGHLPRDASGSGRLLVSRLVLVAVATLVAPTCVVGAHAHGRPSTRPATPWWPPPPGRSPPSCGSSIA
jgi:hypothetical protein